MIQAFFTVLMMAGSFFCTSSVFAQDMTTYRPAAEVQSRSFNTPRVPEKGVPQRIAFSSDLDQVCSDLHGNGSRFSGKVSVSESSASVLVLERSGARKKTVGTYLRSIECISTIQKSPYPTDL